MNKIEVKVLNPEAIQESEKMMVCAARLTQRGHKIHNMNDFMNLYNRDYTGDTVANMVNLPHATIQKFGVINVVVVGASRRFLAQITRHQNEVKFMSASLQYSDYSDNRDFVVPYNILNTDKEEEYLKQCIESMDKYRSFTNDGVDNDTCGYLAPQSLRNILIISATLYQWKHMISQRICKRNTDETRYIMLRIWEQLYAINPTMFSPRTTGMACMQDYCKEGKMSCKNPACRNITPSEIIKIEFPKLR